VGHGIEARTSGTVGITGAGDGLPNGVALGGKAHDESAEGLGDGEGLAVADAEEAAIGEAVACSAAGFDIESGTSTTAARSASTSPAAPAWRSVRRVRGSAASLARARTTAFEIEDHPWVTIAPLAVLAAPVLHTGDASVQTLSCRPACWRRGSGTFANCD
jgi:hypothetical protein